MGISYYAPLYRSIRKTINMQVGLNRYSLLPPAVKNLLIINGIFFLAKFAFATKGIDLNQILGLHYLLAEDFRLWQVVSYMFMHGDFTHLFFNMFALWMFGSTLENHWGSKRFLLYYFVTGIGAALIHYIVVAFQIQGDVSLMNQFLNNPSLETYQTLVNQCDAEALRQVFTQNLQIFLNNPSAVNEIAHATAEIQQSYLNSFNIVGASGSVFGLLLAFGMTFPNAVIYIYFLFPLKAKWFVVIYGGLELFFGMTGVQAGIAHFAHLGGMIFGIFLILYWRKKERENNRYNYFQ